MTLDPVERAHAILGVRPGCTRADLRKAYRQLVKQWHPDRYTADPAGQAEAAIRLREINGAFRLIAERLTGTTTVRPPEASRPPEAPAPPPRAPPASREPGRPLSRSEIDAIVGALGDEGPVHGLIEWAQLLWPFGVGLLFLMTFQGPTPKALEVILGTGFILLGVVLLVRKRFLLDRPQR